MKNNTTRILVAIIGTIGVISAAYFQYRNAHPEQTELPAQKSIPNQNPPAPSPPIVTRSIDAIVLSLWTDTDDKDSEENVSCIVAFGSEEIARGGPWGGGEIWGDQEDRNNGRPHDFEIPLARKIKPEEVKSLSVRVIKSQAGGNGGKGWDARVNVATKDNDGKVEWRVRTGTIKFGNGNSAETTVGL